MAVSSAWLNKHADRLHREFNLNGFVSLPGFLDSEGVPALRSELDRYIRDVVPTITGNDVYYEDKDDPSTLKQLKEMNQYDAYFKQLFMDSPFRSLAAILLGEAVRPTNFQYFNKPAGVGQPTPPHQDGYYFHITPNHAVTLWLALEDIEPEQGCVSYIQGSHRFGTRHHVRTQTLGFSQGIADFGVPNDIENQRSFPCKAGHLLAHHSLIIHRADGNTSADRSRQAMGFVYVAESCEVDIAAKKAYQAQLDADLKKAGKI